MALDDRAHTYASALYDTAWDRWLAALQGAADKLAQNPNLAARMGAPGADVPQQQRVIDGILPPDVDLPVRNFVYLLAQRGDLTMLPDVARELGEMRRQSGAQAATEVEVTSALALNEQERQALIEGLQQYGTEFNVHYRVDPGILGGLIIRVGDRLLDNSLAARLAAMRQTLGVTGG